MYVGYTVGSLYLERAEPTRAAGGPLRAPALPSWRPRTYVAGGGFERGIKYAAGSSIATEKKYNLPPSPLPPAKFSYSFILYL